MKEVAYDYANGVKIQRLTIYLFRSFIYSLPIEQDYVLPVVQVKAAKKSYFKVEGQNLMGKKRSKPSVSCGS